MCCLLGEWSNGKRRLQDIQEARLYSHTHTHSLSASPSLSLSLSPYLSGSRRRELGSLGVGSSFLGVSNSVQPQVHGVFDSFHVEVGSFFPSFGRGSLCWAVIWWACKCTAALWTPLDQSSSQHFVGACLLQQGMYAKCGGGSACSRQGER